MSILLVAALMTSTQSIGSAASVPFRTAEDAMLVDATVNGRQLTFMFDTGFGGSVVVDGSVDIGRPTGTKLLRDFVGEFEAPTVPITSLRLGNQTIDSRGMTAVLQRRMGLSKSYNAHVDGIMGFQVIKDRITEINFERSQLIFHPASLDISKRVPDNRRTFLVRMLPIGSNSIELDVRTAAGKQMVLALDTGNAFFATTHREVLERVGLWESNRRPKFMKLSGVASGTVESFYARVRDMRIAGVPVSDSVWSIIDLPKSSADGDGTIGFEFLRNFNITIDFKRRRVWLENFSGQTGNTARAGVGLFADLDPNTRRITIRRVSPDTPADRAGIEAGDLLLSIDGRELLNVGFRRIDRMLEGPPGSKIRLVTSRNGVVNRHEMEREFLFNDLP